MKIQAVATLALSLASMASASPTLSNAFVRRGQRTVGDVVFYDLDTAPRNLVTESSLANLATGPPPPVAQISTDEQQ